MVAGVARIQFALKFVMFHILFVTVVSKYLNLRIFSKHLLVIFMLCFCYAFWYGNINIYLVSYVFISKSWRPRGWSSSPGKVKHFSFPIVSRLVLESSKPPIQWVTRASSPVVKLPNREAKHLPPTSEEVKKIWIYTSPPPQYIFMA
jgi:hypothetical protein